MKSIEENTKSRVLCQTLEVSVSRYYDWRQRPISGHAQADAQLAERIQAANPGNRGLYGSPRVYAQVKEQGIRCSRKRIARLMREQGLCARRRAHRSRTTSSEPGARIAPNLLNQEFSAAHPNEKWAGDITAVWTRCRLALPGGGA